MKYLLLLCSGLLLFALASLPIGYYTFLRIVVSIVAIVIVVTEFENGFNFWVITFGIIAILFNPLIPIYLNNKDAWIPIDILAAIIFLFKSFYKKKIH